MNMCFTLTFLAIGALYILSILLVFIIILTFISSIMSKSEHFILYLLTYIY